MDHRNRKIYITSSTTTFIAITKIISCAFKTILFWKIIFWISTLEKKSLIHWGSHEDPARTAWSLIFWCSNHALLSPVNWYRSSNFQISFWNIIKWTIIIYSNMKSTYIMINFYLKFIPNLSRWNYFAQLCMLALLCYL